MKCKVNDLSFLDLYVLCSDQKNELNDKVQITPLDNDEVIFSQFSNEIKLLTKLKCSNDIEDSFIYPVSVFNKIIKSFGKDTQIEIKEDKIIRDSSEYSISKPDILSIGEEEIQDMLKVVSNLNSNTQIVLKDLNKWNIIKNGLDKKEYNILHYYDNYYIASDIYNITSAVKTENTSIEDDLFLQGVILSIVNSYKLEEIKLHFIEEYDQYVLIMDNTYLFFPSVSDVKLPNIFEEEWKNQYDHPFKVRVNKKDLIDVLNRLSITIDTFDRIFLTISDNSIILENKDNGYCREEIDIDSVDKELIDKTFCISLNYLLSSTYHMEDIFDMHVSLDSELPLLIKDSEKFYIINLYQKQEK